MKINGVEGDEDYFDQKIKPIDAISLVQTHESNKLNRAYKVIYHRTNNSQLTPAPAPAMETINDVLPCSHDDFSVKIEHLRTMGKNFFSQSRTPSRISQIWQGP